MNFKPDEKNIRSLLKSGCQFVIPRFQREYSWDKKNYQEFFEDMINNLVVSSGVINDDQYFLGTMLFVGNFAEKPDKPIEVVDGQQRLTTITILFSVLSDRFRELGEDTLSKQLFKQFGKDLLSTPLSFMSTRKSNTKTEFTVAVDAAEELYGIQLHFNFSTNDVKVLIDSYRTAYSQEICDRCEALIRRQMRHYGYLIQ